MYEPVPLTKADYLRNVRVAVLNLQHAVIQLEMSHRGLFNQIWNNEKLTTQEIMDEFGSSACLLFRDSGALQTAFMSIIKDYVPLMPGSYTVNEDGTVTTPGAQA